VLQVVVTSLDVLAPVLLHLSADPNGQVRVVGTKALCYALQLQKGRQVFDELLKQLDDSNAASFEAFARKHRSFR
jgi:hypothetical protein